MERKIQEKIIKAQLEIYQVSRTIQGHFSKICKQLKTFSIFNDKNGKRHIV
jgi:hypothetical protein